MQESTVRADQKTAGYQEWRNLAFLHWHIEPSQLSHLLPSGLQIETHDNRAWLGLVPFRMERVRPWWFPAVPGISWFPETNLRTYVVHDSAGPGVWFFSLEACARLAVTIGRSLWHLNYFYSRLQISSRSLETGEDCVRREYSGSRPSGTPASYSIGLTVRQTDLPRTAAPDTLEYFLVERYRLFAAGRNGKLRSGMVHHTPYTFRDVSDLHCEQNLTQAAGITADLTRPPDHALHSDGVDVRVSPLQSIS